jgi:isocitrate dehydrogenase kinase/phosphatase
MTVSTFELMVHIVHSDLRVSASWLDHSRDLLYMINQFRHDMPQPIVGVGHSMGAGQL